ncbi:MAG: hypothetical protein ACFE8B_12080 [Candidatus Hermodarchaeota archaeon]
MYIINTENGFFNNDRFRDNAIKKVKRLKIGIIIAIIAGSLFIASQSLMLVNQNWYNVARQEIYIDYENGKIDYDTYDAKRDKLELNLYTNMLAISILGTIATVSVTITFIFIIISLLSIVIDDSFNRKMRRLALGLAIITLLFVLHPLFFGTSTFYYIT